MTTGIGNPDWQRRYNFSAVPLFSFSFTDTGAVATAVFDANGYEYIMVSVNTGSSVVFGHLVFTWSQDSAGAIPVDTHAFTFGPGSTQTIKLPVLTRYYFFNYTPSAGGTGQQVKGTIYGTNADQENLLTQNTDIPIIWANPSILAGATDTETYNATCGFGAVVMIDDGGNNLWTGTLQYYDFPTQSWKSFWRARGAAAGQTITQLVYLPYAPVRLQVTNNDTAVHTFILSMVGP